VDLTRELSGEAGPIAPNTVRGGFPDCSRLGPPFGMGAALPFTPASAGDRQTRRVSSLGSLKCATNTRNQPTRGGRLLVVNSSKGPQVSPDSGKRRQERTTLSQQVSDGFGEPGQVRAEGVLNVKGSPGQIPLTRSLTRPSDDSGPVGNGPSFRGGRCLDPRPLAPSFNPIIRSRACHRVSRQVTTFRPAFGGDAWRCCRRLRSRLGCTGYTRQRETATDAGRRRKTFPQVSRRFWQLLTGVENP